MGSVARTASLTVTTASPAARPPTPAEN